MAVYRIYVERKEGFELEALEVLNDLRETLGIRELKSVRILNRYDVEGVTQEVLLKACGLIFSDPVCDRLYKEMPEYGDADVFAVSYLPGQFDQRADSCAQCIQILTREERPKVRYAKVYIMEGIRKEDLKKAKDYLINPVESCEAALEIPLSLTGEFPAPAPIEVLRGFCGMRKDELLEFLEDFGLAMDYDDLRFCQHYFKEEEHRDPTVTEIRMIDTYWSDHCRHTTFLTHIDGVEIVPAHVKASYEKYLEIRRAVFGEKAETRPVTLMDMATIGAKYLLQTGALTNLDQSEEINACSVRIDVEINGKNEPWLFMFKNETHNHPTEIEPFGGAATCLGGAIRDPLSGRAYVYQAMRITGAGNPLASFEETRKGKLPQKKITLGAAAGYSSYGNQIGLATGLVHEIYHPGYAAKRMEIGAVVGAAPASNVRRETPLPGDLVILLGGRTGRDGCGGATGSSKSHTVGSLESCGAEVQKGNPPEERKLQRLFRNPEVTNMIKRCNDFGAGGISVAIGELADGLEINLDAVQKKYEGLSGTELAISESQERMAVVISAKDESAFIALAALENLEATRVAVVTGMPRLVMSWNGNEIVNLSRSFLNSNGAAKKTAVRVPEVLSNVTENKTEDTERKWLKMLGGLNICSQKGLGDRFDSSIGAGTVLMPYGGKSQKTEIQAMAAKLPVLEGETTTCSLMSWGFDPYISEIDPYKGAVCAVVDSVAKLIAAGGNTEQCWLTFQEYFERTKGDPVRWGKPFAALLGALEAQVSLGIAAIGGKDSMSGSFEEMDVPPTLVSFASGIASAEGVISPEFKAAGHEVVLLRPVYKEEFLPDYESLQSNFRIAETLIRGKKAVSAWAVGAGGLCEAVSKMAFGNKIGFTFFDGFENEDLYIKQPGAILLELGDEVSSLDAGGEAVGRTIPEAEIHVQHTVISLEDCVKAWEETLEPVFPQKITDTTQMVKTLGYAERNTSVPAVKAPRPRVLIPVFPGTNCEYDTARRFSLAGGDPDIFVLRNLTPSMIEDSLKELENRIRGSQMIMIPGGFSGGDEPDGSGKFIATVFRNLRISDAVHELLQKRDGLILGICNGFQALIKLGLVPFGEIRELDETCPTLTYNRIGRHQSGMVRTRISSCKSPWLSLCEPGDIYSIPVSHGEGRFIASDEMFRSLAENGQIATQYVDHFGKASMEIVWNPNTSFGAVEGITSPDGRVFGKMAHSERIGSCVAKNIPGRKDQQLFEAGVRYFK